PLMSPPPRACRSFRTARPRALGRARVTCREKLLGRFLVLRRLARPDAAISSVIGGSTDARWTSPRGPYMTPKRNCRHSALLVWSPPRQQRAQSGIAEV